MWRNSQALAYAHCRSSVRFESPKVSAISSLLSPPKNFSTTIRSSSGSSTLSSLQRLIHQQNLVVGCRIGQFQVLDVQPRLTAAMLEPGFVARPLDQNAAHGLSGCAEKVGAILPGAISVVDQPQPGLMHQRRGLKRVAGHLMGHSRARQPPQFGIYQWKKLFGRAFLAATNRLQDERNRSGVSHSDIVESP